MYMFRGMGAAAQDVQVGSSIAEPVATAVAAPAAAAAFAIPLAVAVPLIGAAIAGVALGVEALLNSGCGQSCVLTSDDANKAQQLAQQNLDAYMALPVPRSQSNQTAALQNATNIYNWLIQACQNIGGQGGKQCVADRVPGGKYAFAPSFIDPIQNDPNVVPDSQATASSAASTATSPSILLWLGIAAAGVFLVWSFSR